MGEYSLDLTGARVLIIDDVPANLDVLCDALMEAGFDALVAADGTQGLEVAAHGAPDLILLDVVMPGLDGFEVCRRLKADPAPQGIPIIFLSAKDETADIVTGFAAGGVDYVVKPFQIEEVLARVRTHVEKSRLARTLVEKNQQLEAEIARRQAVSLQRNHLAERLSLISQAEVDRWNVAGMVGRSQIMRQVLDQVDMLHQSPTASVLITGESGTGKELVARAIHLGGTRADESFVPVNCSTVPRELAESLLFGHVRGAFTGAEENRTGYFELADGGTLFLDEIGDLPLDLQPKFLRVLEDGHIRPVGAAADKAVEVRVVAATNADLPASIEQGHFRQDLYYRLARFTVRVPALREHLEDVPLLTEHFLALFAREMNLEPPVLSPEALEVLEGYDFPGNVRELKNIVERALIQSRGADIQPEHLQLALEPTSTAGPPSPSTRSRPGSSWSSAPWRRPTATWPPLPGSWAPAAATSTAPWPGRNGRKGGSDSGALAPPGVAYGKRSPSRSGRLARGSASIPAAIG